MPAKNMSLVGKNTLMVLLCQPLNILFWGPFFLCLARQAQTFPLTRNISYFCANDLISCVDHPSVGSSTSFVFFLKHYRLWSLVLTFSGLNFECTCYNSCVIKVILSAAPLSSLSLSVWRKACLSVFNDEYLSVTVTACLPFYVTSFDRLPGKLWVCSTPSPQKHIFMCIILLSSFFFFLGKALVKKFHCLRIDKAE